MQKVVIDTNVLASALWSAQGKPAQLLTLVLNDILTPCFDYRIMQEYREVLNRPKFQFSKANVNDILNKIKADGLSVAANPIDICFEDQSDKKFYEVAKYCRAFLITGNIRHYPKDECVVTVSEYLDGVFKYN